MNFHDDFPGNGYEKSPIALVFDYLLQLNPLEGSEV